MQYASSAVEDKAGLDAIADIDRVIQGVGCELLRGVDTVSVSDWLVEHNAHTGEIVFAEIVNIGAGEPLRPGDLVELGAVRSCRRCDR